MDRLHMMIVFVAVAEEEGFAGGARRLNMSPPAVTRSIAALEAHLGVKLFKRTTRFVRMTDAGQRYLEDARRVIAAADEADELAAGANAEPRGHLGVTAPILFGRLHIMPGIVAYMQRYPAMQVSAMFADRVVNLLEEDVDVAFRIGELPDSGYHAIRVGMVRRVICAAPRYLAEHGTPHTPEDLSQHQMVLSKGINPNLELKFTKQKTPLSIKIKPRLLVSDNASAIEAAADGLGIVAAISYQIASHLAAGSLAIILSEYELKPIPVHIVHGEGRHASAKVRAFIDLMTDTLRNNPALLQ
jgi:DNA-binding transcriptional LysR family regulator